MQSAARAVGAYAATPLGTGVAAALLIGGLCGGPKRGAAGGLGVAGLAFALQSYWESLMDLPSRAGKEGERLLLSAEEKARQFLKDTADALGLGSIFNPLIDGMFGAVRMAIMGGSGLLQQLLGFMKSYGLMILMAMLAYRYLR